MERKEYTTEYGELTIDDCDVCGAALRHLEGETLQHAVGSTGLVCDTCIAEGNVTGPHVSGDGLVEYYEAT